MVLPDPFSLACPRSLRLGFASFGRPAFFFGLSQALELQFGQRCGFLPFCENHDSVHWRHVRSLRRLNVVVGISPEFNSSMVGMESPYEASEQSG